MWRLSERRCFERLPGFVCVCVCARVRVRACVRACDLLVALPPVAPSPWVARLRHLRSALPFSVFDEELEAVDATWDKL
eukprot:745725-Alexandrium_andersonii.AAC.1